MHVGILHMPLKYNYPELASLKNAQYAAAPVIQQ